MRHSARHLTIIRSLLTFVSVAFFSWVITVRAGQAPEPSGRPPVEKPTHDMVVVSGGDFQMGDVFGEGSENERPVHEVHVEPFSLAKTETTVAQFRAFVRATGYRTSAEHPENLDGFQKGGPKERPKTMADRLRAHYQLLAICDGVAVWNIEQNRWSGYQPGTNWKNPGFPQTEQDPVVAVSWDDAIHYCNWLSKEQGLPVAYDEKTRKLVDKNGNETADIRAVKGFRLPTEAEWEYAAREGGRNVRFGTGKDVAKSTEIVFRADAGSYEYLEPGANRKKTLPVGSLPANRLGFHDLSGNAWEWTSDDFGPYPATSQRNPHNTVADEQPQKVLRGGRWGGDAREARVFSRDPYLPNDRCNNSGFRIARSVETNGH